MCISDHSVFSSSARLRDLKGSLPPAGKQGSCSDKELSAPYTAQTGRWPGNGYVVRGCVGLP